MAKKLVFRNGRMVVVDDEENKEPIKIPRGYTREDVKPITDISKESPFESIPEVEKTKQDLLEAIDPTRGSGSSGNALTGYLRGALAGVADAVIPTSLAGITAAVSGAAEARPFGVPKKIPEVTLTDAGLLRENPPSLHPITADSVRAEEAARAAKHAESMGKNKLYSELPKTELSPYTEYQGKELSTGEAFKDLEPPKKLGSEAGVLKLPDKSSRARALIEKTGGKNIQYNEETNTIRWTKGKEQFEANLNERFGPRNLGVSPRQQGTSLRDIGANDRSPLAKALRGEDPNTGRGYSVESQAKIDEAKKLSLPKQVQKALKETPTDLNAPEDEVFKGFTDETSKLTNKGPGLKLGDLPGYEKERGAFGKSQPLPTVALKGKYRFDTKLNNIDLNFTNDFDKAAYTLAGGKPNNAMLRELANQTGLDESTILAHGTRLRSQAAKGVTSLPKGATSFDIAPKQVRVMGSKADRPKLWEELLNAPSETKFAIDLPSMRQSYRPFLLHPIKSGLPALKNAFKSVTEQGYHNVLEDLSNSPVYKRLEQYRALPADTEKLFPNIATLNDLPSNDLDAYFLENSRLEDLPGIGTHGIRPSKRMFDAFQKSIRGSEVSRLAPNLDELLAGGPEEARTLKQIINRVSDETGHGTLGELGDRAIPYLNKAFTAPRNLAAKFQFYNPLNYVPENALNKMSLGEGSAFNLNKLRRNIGGTGDVAYRDFIKDQAKLLAGQGAGLYAAHKAGADVDMDPLSSNFGVRFGNYKPDLFGGELGLVREMARLGTLSPMRTSSRGKEYEGTPIDEDIKFLRGRLRPGLPSMAFDFRNYNPDTGARENWLGEDISKPYDTDTAEGKMAHTLMGDVADKPYSRWITQQFTPSYLGDILDASNEGLPTALAATGLGILGSGGSTYDPFENNPYRAPKKVIKVKRRKPGQYEQKHSKPAGSSSGSSGGYTVVN